MRDIDGVFYCLFSLLCLAEFAFTGQTTVEMMIPGNKVGLIIGKGGETIKQLQTKCGCKMMMIQDGQYQNAPEKPLRITGKITGNLHCLYCGFSGNLIVFR